MRSNSDASQESTAFKRSSAHTIRAYVLNHLPFLASKPRRNGRVTIRDFGSEETVIIYKTCTRKKKKPSEKLTPISPEVLVFFSSASASLSLPEPLPPPKDVFSFGDNRRLSDELLSLALSDEKTGTTSLPIPDPLHWSVGDYSYILDGEGKSAAVMRTTEFVRCRFGEVTEEMTASEGEDDRTLECWRREHRRYYERQEGGEGFHEGVQVLFKRFEIVWPSVEKK